jgi:hypothetical protein
MLLYEVLMEEKQKPGTYVGVRFSKDTVERIRKYIEANNIPTPIRADRLHSTVLSSEQHIEDFNALGNLESPMIGKPSKLEVWKSRPSDGSEPANCLVLKYDCEALEQRHETLIDEHNATHKYDGFKPHVTLSYDIGDLDHNDFTTIADIGDIEIVEEYREDLDNNWAKTKGTEDSRSGADRRKTA